jgi:hypothetical protein
MKFRRHPKFTLRANWPGQAVTSAAVLIGSLRVRCFAALLVGAAAVVVVAGCTAVTGGDAAVNAVDAPAYRTSIAASSSQAAASSSARESERQASMTTAALRSSCETLTASSADAIDSVNAYVSAFNEEGGNLETTEGPAVDALYRSAAEVDDAITDVMGPELSTAFAAWVDGAYAAAEAISAQVEPAEFNEIIGELNNARSEALDLCDATY